MDFESILVHDTDEQPELASVPPPSQEWHSSEREPLYSFSTPQRIHGHGPSPRSKPTDDVHILVHIAATDQRRESRNGVVNLNEDTKILQYASWAGPIDFSWFRSYVHCPQLTMTATVIFRIFYPDAIVSTSEL